MNTRKLLVRTVTALLAFSGLPFSAAAQEARVASARAGVEIPIFTRATEGAKATLVLLPGGAGGMGQIGTDGWPNSANFLTRSAQNFATSGFNVVVMARASDLNDLDYHVRVSKDHVEDIRRVLQMVKERFPGPVWLVGTSRGTISATAASIALRDEKLVDGIVLTSSVTSLKTGAVPSQDLAAIRIPVLVLHHDKDACRVCQPHEASSIVRGLRNAPVKKLVMVNGGMNASGDPCGNQHYHGFIGMEREAVSIITGWINNPAS